MSKRSSRSNKKSKRVKISKKKGTKRSGAADDSRRSLVEGEERKLHEEIIDRRVRGGTALTDEEITEAYALAQKQWQELPGAIVRPPTDITLPSQKGPKSKDNISSTEQSDNDAANGGHRD